jgi:hypothetical protein
MKNIQIIDGASNSVFEIYAIADTLFAALFPNGTDVAFAKDYYAELPITDRLLKNLYKRRVDKKSIRGIHGTLHLDSSQVEPKFFPTRRESEVIDRAPFPKNFKL